MIVETSALVAILRGEPERDRCLRAIAAADYVGISTASLLEASIVIDSHGDPVASRRLDDLVARAGIEVEPVTAHQAELARAAYRDFGKGSGHPAQLNFGDCFSYALAASMHEPLLYVGDDFAHTDVRAA